MGEGRSAEQGHVLLEQGLDPQVLGEGHVVHQAHIQAVFQQQPLDAVRVSHQGGKLHLGALPPELGQHPGEPGGPKSDVRPHPQPVGGFPQLVLRLLKAPQYLLGRGEQGAPGLGHIDAAIHPLKEPHPIVLFQLLDGQAHCGLGGVQGLGRLRKAHLAADLREYGEMAFCHIRPSLLY